MWITTGLSYTLLGAPFCCSPQGAGGGDDLLCLPIKPVETAARLWQAEVVGFHSWALVEDD